MMNILNKIWNYLKKPYIRRTLVAAAFIIICYSCYRQIPKTASVSAFMTALKAGSITTIIDRGSYLSFQNNQKIWQRVNISTIQKQPLLQQATQKNIEFSIGTNYQHLFQLLSKISATAAFISTIFLFQNKGPSQKPVEHKTQVTFSDIAGNQQAKQALQEIIHYFDQPERYIRVGASLPKGVLLYGPSGTGKTMLARAVAAQAGVSFIHATGSEFIQMYVGVGAARIRSIFTQARQCQPCILFIDEIDCVAFKRSGGDKQNQEYHHTLNQLLSEMDGFRQDNRVVVLAATNKHQMLDQAVLRTGRFDRKIKVDLPEERQRLDILKLNLRKRENRIQEQVLRSLARSSSGWNGADLANVINEASFVCVRRGGDVIKDQHIVEALKQIKDSRKVFESYSMFENFLER